MVSEGDSERAQVGQALHQAALRWPERIAVCDAGSEGLEAQEITYAKLDAMARRAAAVLAARGVSAGDAVALCGENSPQLMAAWFGIVYAGAAAVPVPILSAVPEVQDRVTHARCKWLVHDAARRELATQAAASLCLPLEALSDASVPPLAQPADTRALDTAMVLYTSGTTGKAKGAEISHASLSRHTAALCEHVLRLRAGDVVLCALPLTHSYGIRMAMLAPMLAGARIVTLRRFEAARTLELAHVHRVTWLPAVPTMLAAWANLPHATKPSTLRWVLSAGAPLPDELALRAEACLGVEVRQGYGMTEATFASVNAPPDARVIGSVGKPSPGVELRVIDDAGNEVAPGESGEVCVRGQNVMTRYLHDPEASADALRDGWMHSGDVGRIDADGRLWIVDRIKDLVIRGGYNVYPSEVEDALARHPDVAEVAVIGRPDAMYGEEVVAVIVPRAGCSVDLAGLAALARARLSRTKWPREYAVIERMPLGASGKIQKRELRAWLQHGKLAVVAAPSA